jgi:hypothetical protein
MYALHSRIKRRKNKNHLATTRTAAAERKNGHKRDPKIKRNLAHVKISGGGGGAEGQAGSGGGGGGSAGTGFAK